MIAVFIYNILLIVLYTVAMSFAINIYLKEKRKLFLILAILMVVFILDNVIIYMTEFINSFASSYNEIFMNVPVIKTIIFMANNFCSIWIITTLAQEKIKPNQIALLIVTGVWMMAIPIMDDSALQVWLYYLPNQLLLMYLGGYAWWKYKKRTELSPRAQQYLKWIAVICCVSGLCILLEDTFVIFNVDEYTFLSLKIYNRNICEDIFSIVVCLLTFHYLAYDAFKKTTDGEEEEQSEAALFANFCKQYQLTQREEEILLLLLDHKQNQEIADELFLSIGTVKTHVHNIYVKLEIKKRNQLFSTYQNFLEGPSEKATDM